MKLLLVGDVMLGRFVNNHLKNVPPSYPWGDTLPIFRRADMRICNLECVLADIGQPWTQTPKVFHFRSDARNVAVLQAAGIDYVSLANNHTLDYGYEAMLAMLATLDKAGIQHAGAGHDLAEASRPAIFTQGDTRIGCIAFTDNEPVWAATDSSPGIFYVPISLDDRRAQVLFDCVRAAKQQVDWLIVSAHWGPNWGREPRPPQVAFAHALVDHGADIIHGHSCHVLQGVERYRQRLIVYSCGDFVDDYRVDETERNDRSCIFSIDVSKNAIQHVRLHPTVIRRFQARRAKGGEARMIVENLRARSARLRIA